MDLGGGSLSGLAGLPHVGDVGSRGDPNTVRRMVAEMITLVTEREARFRASGIDSMATYRAMRGVRRDPADDRFGDAFLVIDGWGAFRHRLRGARAARCWPSPSRACPTACT